MVSAGQPRRLERRRCCRASTPSTPMPARCMHGADDQHHPEVDPQRDRARTGSTRTCREVSLITKDAFEPSLPLSVVVHIDYRKAPLVIQRFGDVKRLVEQTLDPMVSAYFKNIGQTRTLIQLIQERSEIQRPPASEMKEKFAHYNLELEEVLIGTPTSSHGDKQDRGNPDAAPRAADRRGAGRDLRAPGEGGGQGARAARGRGARPPAAGADRVGDLHHRAEQPGQGRVPALRSQQAAQIRALAEAEAQRDSHARRSRGRPGGARRYRRGDRDRGAGPRLRRAAVPGHPAGDEPLRRGDRDGGRRRRAPHRRSAGAATAEPRAAAVGRAACSRPCWP